MVPGYDVNRLSRAGTSEPASCLWSRLVRTMDDPLVRLVQGQSGPRHSDLQEVKLIALTVVNSARQSSVDSRGTVLPIIKYLSCNPMLGCCFTSGPNPRAFRNENFSS